MPPYTEFACARPLDAAVIVLPEDAPDVSSRPDMVVLEVPIVAVAVVMALLTVKFPEAVMPRTAHILSIATGIEVDADPPAVIVPSPDALFSGMLIVPVAPSSVAVSAPPVKVMASEDR